MSEKAEEKVPAKIANDLQKFAHLLDPRLVEKADAKKPANTERWPVRKALTFIFGTSLLIWALVFALIYYLI